MAPNRMNKPRAKNEQNLVFHAKIFRADIDAHKTKWRLKFDAGLKYKEDAIPPKHFLAINNREIIAYRKTSLFFKSILILFLVLDKKKT